MIDELINRTMEHTLGDLGRSRMIAAFCERNITGDYIDFGTFRGAIAAIMSYFAEKYNKQVHVYDTFEGLPAFSKIDMDSAYGLTEGGLMCSHAVMVDTLKQLEVPMDRINFYKGVFGEDSVIHASACSVASVDFDLYDGTYWALRKTLSILSRSGVMVVHDYHDGMPGVKKAVDDFRKIKNMKFSHENDCAVLLNEDI